MEKKGRASREISEADLALALRRRLEADEWTCYGEVQLTQGARRADIVATAGTRVMIVETKLSLSIDVISQALSWLGKAHWVVIAVPAPKGHQYGRYEFVVDYLGSKGIGLWWIEGAGEAPSEFHDPARIREVVRPRLHRYAHAQAQQIRAVLVPEMRDTVAGAKTGGVASTPFKRTCLRVRDYVKRYPGLTFDAVIRSIEHHYSSVTSARAQANLIVEKAGLVLAGGRLFVEGDPIPSSASLTPQPARREVRRAEQKSLFS